MQMISIRNPCNVMLNVYIDLHGFNCQQGIRVLTQYLKNKQEQLVKGELKPNKDAQTHMIQVITGEGNLERKVGDFLNMAEFDHINKGGAYLIRLTTSQKDFEANQAKVALRAEMLEAADKEFKKEKMELMNFRKERRQGEKEEKKAERCQKKEERKAERCQMREERKAERVAAKEERKAERIATKGNFICARREVKLALVEQGFACFQIKQIRMGLANRDATISECEAYIAENNMRPAKVVRVQQKAQLPQEDTPMESNL